MSEPDLKLLLKLKATGTLSKFPLGLFDTFVLSTLTFQVEYNTVQVFYKL